MLSPFSLPLTGVSTPPDTNEPEIVWNSCLRLSSPSLRCQFPATFAGTIHNNAVQYVVQFSLTVTLWSAFHSPIVNELDTMRVPGFRSRILGRSLRLISG